MGSPDVALGDRDNSGGASAVPSDGPGQSDVCSDIDVEYCASVASEYGDGASAVHNADASVVNGVVQGVVSPVGEYDGDAVPADL